MKEISGVWRGENVCIIGGGCSLIEHFKIPMHVVEKVRAGELSPSAYSEYLKPLHNQKVIGVNAAYMLGDWVDICFFGDPGFYTISKHKLKDFKGRVISTHPKFKNSEVEYLPTEVTEGLGISAYQNKVRWNYSSGVTAVDLAVKLGASSIHLIGFDMKLDAGGNEHWHNEYRLAKKPDHMVENRQVPFGLCEIAFKAIVSDLNQLGIQIYSISENNAGIEVKSIM